MALYKRGKTGIWWTRFTVNGSTTRCSLGTTDKKKAGELERQLKAQTDDDIHNKRMGRSLNRTFGEAVVYWLESRDYPQSMMSHIRLVSERLKKVPLADIPEAAELMRHELMASGLSAGTINRRLSVVRRVLTLAKKRWKWITVDLASQIEFASEKGSEREVFLTAEETDHLISFAPSEQLRDFLIVSANTGMRRGELHALKPSHLRSGAVLLTSDITKSSKPRMIPLLPEVEAILLKRLPWTFTINTLSHQFHTARVRAGRPNVRLHDLRHSFASRLAENPDVPMTAVRDLLGHSNLSITNRYSHLRNEALRAAINTLARPVMSHLGHEDMTTSSEEEVVDEE